MKKILLLFSLSILIYACGSDDDAPIQEPEVLPFDYTQQEKNAEIAWIENYIKDNGITGMEKSESGLFYRIEKQGDGIEGAKAGVVSIFDKTIIAKTGKVVDTTDRDRYPNGEPYSLGQGQQAGLIETIRLLNEGGKATLIIPSFLAIGKRTDYYGRIEPETILIREIEFVFIIGANGN
ncbi:FKBP-type peptidyl-prolyl cis-trans isomerase [Aquimarina macrocephali]|uniref:FKBP-type peptidyl-prolyl cis-trans isomerase n=1 Tax=Aquimarina macrocephali TaxID=666563 RepID=UPI00046766F8|nr:hypothetical protein [Aquimarina macrocephali]